MPWDDLEADGYTGIELWSFVTDTAERVNSIRDLLSFVLAPQRFLDHPPQRNLEEWDRLCRRRRCVGLGGADAHQIGIRVARPRAVAPDGLQALVPASCARTCWWTSRCGTSWRRTAPRCSARCGRARVPRGGLGGTRAGIQVLGRGGDAALTMGDEASAGRLDAACAASRGGRGCA